MNNAILIIEDSPMLSDMLALRLAKNFPNHEVLCTASVTRAIELSEIFDVEIVLSDLDVADSRGISTATRVREATGAPVIIHSDSMGNETDRAQAIELGFADTFIKGNCKLDSLLERMRCVLRDAGTDESGVPDALRRLA